MLHGQVIRSPHLDALIKSIGASRALTLDEVRAVVTGTELPEVSGLAVDVPEGSHLDMRFASDNCRAKDKVLYKGHAVAAVAATTPHIAQQALGPIYVQYEVLPWVIDVRKAMKADVPILHDKLACLSNPDMIAAIANVVGARMTSLPMSSGKVLETIQDKGGNVG